MEEIVYRRYSRVLKENDSLPDLIIIDGGKGQLSAAYKSIVRLGITEKINIIGIAKRLEDIYKPGNPEPLSVDKRSPTLKLIQRARDEAHRFAITHHRNKRSKETMGTELSEIKGIGESTIKKLLEYYKSVKKIKEATPSGIKKLIGDKKATLISDYFNKFVN
jgi:excinuclease ABC subunit C